MHGFRRVTDPRKTCPFAKETRDPLGCSRGRSLLRASEGPNTHPVADVEQLELASADLGPFCARRPPIVPRPKTAPLPS